MTLRERFHDLLILRATADCTDEQGRELDAIIRDHPDWDADQFDLAAAAIQLAFVRPVALPVRLRQQIHLSSHSS